MKAVLNQTTRGKVSGVYAIVHLRSGRRYVGSAAYVVGRWTVHRHQLRKGNHHCSYLQRAWNKYDEDQFRFKLLESCAVNGLAQLEQHYMDETPPGKLFNIQPIARS